MATITYQTYLMVKDTAEYEKLIDIKDYPDMLPQRENVETTTLSNGARTYTMGIINQEGSLDFTANYEKEDIVKLKKLVGVEKEYAVWFGASAEENGKPDGNLGKFEWKGKLSYTISGKGVNDVREIVVHITPTTPVVQAE